MLVLATPSLYQKRNRGDEVELEKKFVSKDVQISKCYPDQAKN